MYPLAIHPLLVPVARALESAHGVSGLTVEPIREVRTVWGSSPRGTLSAANLVGPGAHYTDGTTERGFASLVCVSLGNDAEPRRTGLSGTNSDGSLWWQTETTHREMVVVVRAPAEGWTMEQFQSAIREAGGAVGSG